ncbi:hypothetical protein PR048_023491 [Dryococelus australis]|uniref:Uncharacterized protein n=1 Tax=Dryococelus australis TaxID=614101 RepID=A0ABQ9GU87_9NEOP|nr:hypothetical protein PR048_023491 [Dryococelus australis]
MAFRGHTEEKVENLQPQELLLTDKFPKIINYVITNFGLSFSDLRGKCYDGKIKRCENHYTKITAPSHICALQEPQFEFGTSSLKRKALFSNIHQDEVPCVNTPPRPLFPTR